MEQVLNEAGEATSDHQLECIQLLSQKYVIPPELTNYLELRRHIPITKLAGLTKAMHEKSLEFVLHVTNDYDYRLESKE